MEQEHRPWPAAEACMRLAAGGGGKAGGQPGPPARVHVRRAAAHEVVQRRHALAAGGDLRPGAGGVGLGGGGWGVGRGSAHARAFLCMHVWGKGRRGQQRGLAAAAGPGKAGLRRRRRRRRQPPAVAKPHLCGLCVQHVVAILPHQLAVPGTEHSMHGGGSLAGAATRRSRGRAGAGRASAAGRFACACACARLAVRCHPTHGSGPPKKTHVLARARACIATPCPTAAHQLRMLPVLVCPPSTTCSPGSTASG